MSWIFIFFCTYNGQFFVINLFLRYFMFFKWDILSAVKLNWCSSYIILSLMNFFKPCTEKVSECDLTPYSVAFKKRVWFNSVFCGIQEGMLLNLEELAKETKNIIFCLISVGSTTSSKIFFWVSFSWYRTVVFRGKYLISFSETVNE